MSPWRRRLLRSAAVVVLLLTGLFAVGFLVFQSDWLREQIRRRTLMEIARATGGRPEGGVRSAGVRPCLRRGDRAP